MQLNFCRMPLLTQVINDAELTLVYLIILGASACVELNQFEEAVTWCDKGLAVSFTIDF